MKTDVIIVGGFHEAACQNRQERNDVIATKTTKIVAERIRPVLDANFITIDKRTFKSGPRQWPRIFDDLAHHALREIVSQLYLAYVETVSAVESEA